jgi:hypothetical protein
MLVAVAWDNLAGGIEARLGLGMTLALPLCLPPHFDKAAGAGERSHR